MEIDTGVLYGVVGALATCIATLFSIVRSQGKKLTECARNEARFEERSKHLEGQIKYLEGEIRLIRNDVKYLNGEQK